MKLILLSLRFSLKRGCPIELFVLDDSWLFGFKVVLIFVNVADFVMLFTFVVVVVVAGICVEDMADVDEDEDDGAGGWFEPLQFPESLPESKLDVSLELQLEQFELGL